jgi:UDP-N-acetylmuramoyl-tripeptide--D-alanyl-D-alanine ligase
VAAAADGVRYGPDVTVDGVTIDSRAVTGGELFVAVVADRDGHDFVDDALTRGAAGYVRSRPLSDGEDREAPIVVVPDTAAALLALGGQARSRLPDRVVGITGSVGKTSTKDLLRAVLARRYVTAASAASFNNELGVPLTLANAPDGTEATVVEMGARGVGHIARLCAVAGPTVGVVTAVAEGHLELFGSVEAVARAKGELVESLPAHGAAVLNADDPRVSAMAARTAARVVTFGADSGGDVRAEAVVLDEEARPSFRLCSPWGSTELALALRGRHQVTNALAAAAAALVCDVGLDDVVAGLSEATCSPMRMQLLRAPSGAVVLNDAYNANPTSARAALDALAALPGERRMAVLGPMAELGPESDAMHAAVAAYATGLGIEVITVAAPAYGGPAADSAADLDAALERLGPLGPGDVVLVKASRVAGLERLAERLVGP